MDSGAAGAALARVDVGVVVNIAPVEPVQLSCGAAAAIQFTADGDGPATWSLVDGPPGAAMDPEGVLRWNPTREDTGTRTVRVRATTATRVTEADVEIAVACEHRAFGVGCSSSGAVLMTVLGAFLLLRRRE